MDVWVVLFVKRGDVEKGWGDQFCGNKGRVGKRGWIGENRRFGARGEAMIFWGNRRSGERSGVGECCVQQGQIRSGPASLHLALCQYLPLSWRLLAPGHP